MAGTRWVRAVVPVLGLRRGQSAELAESDFLQKVIDNGFLEPVNKAEAKQAAEQQTAPPVDPQVTAKPGEQ